MVETVEVVTRGEVVFVKLNRPKVRNALSTELVRGISGALLAAEGSSEVGACVITGEGGVFCAGGDLSDIPDGARPPYLAERHRIFVGLSQVIARMTKPVIAAVNGPAVGAGAALALTCDHVVMAERAYMSFPFVSLGLPPDLLSASELVRRAGGTIARDLLYRSRKVGSAEALSLHLVDAVFPDDELDGVALREGVRMASLSRFAFALTKDLLRNAYLPSGLAAEFEPLAVAAAACSDEFRSSSERYRK